MRLRPASKYSGCRLRQERPGSAILAKKRGNRWCEPGDRGPANSCRPITQVPPRWAAGPEQAIARTGVTRAPRSHRTKAKASPAHRRRRSIVLRGAGPEAPEVNGPEAPGAARFRAGGQRMRWGGARRPPRSLPRARQPGRPIPATPHPARPHRLHGVLQDGRELGKHPVPGLQQLLPGRPGELLDAPPPPLLRLPGPLQSEGGCGRGAEDGGRAGGAAARGARGARRAAPRTLGWDSGPHGARRWRWR